MNQLGAILLASAGAISAVAVPAEKPGLQHLYGPAPSWPEYRRIAEEAVIAKMIDPESARITWLSGDWKGRYKPLLEPHTYGYVACGSVNAKNRMGGYTGATTFIVVIDYGRVLLLDIDARANSRADEGCAAAIRGGLAPPVPQIVEAPPAAAATSMAGTMTSAPSAAGLSLRAMPEGAYVTAVILGSPAAVAGLKPGMVITLVNGIALAGMGDAATKVVDAAGAKATLTLVGGTIIKLGADR